MKKLLLATAVAALSVSAANAAPTVYGKAFLTADYKDVDGDTSAIENNIGARLDNRVYTPEYNGTSLNSTGSRIGIKGGEPLTANTDLVYQLEYGIKVDDNADQFKSRDTYLGLSNKQYGTLLAGRLTTIDDQIQYANQASGGVLGGDDVLATVTAPRANNAFAYFSPDYNVMTFMAMYGLDNDQYSNAKYPDIDLGEFAGHEQYGVGVKYEPANQPFRAGATYIKSGDFNTTRLSGAYDLNNQIGLGALYQISDLDTSDKENLAAVSATYKTATPWTAYAQAEMTSNVGGVDGDDAQRLVLGGKYAFNANATGHVYAGYSNLEQEDQDDRDGFGIGTGIEYKF